MADPRPVVRAYYISLNDEIGATATRPQLWFVVPTTHAGRWDAAVSAWHVLSPRWPNGPKYYSVFAVNTADPPFVWDGRITAMDTQWNLGPNAPSYREPLAATSPITSAVGTTFAGSRGYYIAGRLSNGTFPDTHGLWFAVPAVSRVPVDLAVTNFFDPATSRQYSAFAVDWYGSPLPERLEFYHAALGPLSNYRDWGKVP